jgi:hypothetical protein
MAKMTDGELLALIDTEFSGAMGAPDSEIASERALAWDYYLSKPLGNEIEGQSQVVTSDVSDVVDSIMPSLLRLFTTAENLVAFDPTGPEDVEQAAQESDYTNYVFFKQNEDAFMVLYTWFFDALVQKNGIVKCWYEEIERVTSESYSRLSNAELMALLTDPELEPVEKSEEIDPETSQTLYTVQFKRVCKRGVYRVENVPPEEYRISSDARTINPSKARMVGQERTVPRSELLAMGFNPSVVDSLPAYGESWGSNEKLSRYDRTEESKSVPADRSQDPICLREVYIQCDYEGKGHSELRQVFSSGNEILSNEPSDRQPFHVLSPQPLPHKHFGRATAEKVMDVQQVTSVLTRQTLDNLYHSNNPGHTIWEQAITDNTLDDFLTRRVGSIKRVGRPVAEAVAPDVVPFTAGSSFDMLAYFDKTKRDRTGVHSDAQGLSPDELKHVQQSVMGQSMDMSRMKIEAIARIFAETGIRSLFTHLHELISKHMDKAEVVRLRNQWVPVDPRRWKARYDMTINIGLGIATKETAMFMLNQIIGLQDRIAQGGGMNLLVTPQNIYNTASELVKAAGLKSPDLYFTDPQNQLAPPPSDEAQQLAMAQAQIQQRQQMLDAADQQLKRDKILLDHKEALLKLREEQEKREDEWMIKQEELRNELLEIKLKYDESQKLLAEKPKRKYNPATGAVS